MPQFIQVSLPNAFSLWQISESGQCFRLREYEKNKFVAITGRHAVDIHQIENSFDYRFFCSANEFYSVWTPYFDLDTDYLAFQNQMKDDPFLCAAIGEGGGIRILRQDLWETAVTFVISQCNNIPRIRKSVEILCREFGSFLGEFAGQPIYAFPTPQQLRGKNPSKASLGYREFYVKELALQDPCIWQQLQSMSDILPKETLLSLRGVGEKVANCILLFGLHRMDSYPRDVWINRLIRDVYHNDFDPNRYAGFAGYVQQLQFYYYRKIAK